MKPLIALNFDVDEKDCSCNIKKEYFEAVAKAGGVPVLLPPMSDDELEQIFSKIDGLILIGGLDYSPQRYNEDTGANVHLINPIREEFDFRLAKRALRDADFPILGICGGCQLLNIELGGTLIQDIKTELPHSEVMHTPADGWQTGSGRHEVRLEALSTLRKLYGSDRISVPTSHHQAVRNTGAGLKATAFADDGVVEAVEHQSRAFTIGVQWHPERDFPTHKNLFETFIKFASGAHAATSA